MKYQISVEKYLAYLTDKNYSKKEIMRKRVVLKKWFSYVLALYVPEAVIYVRNIEKHVFYYKNKIYTNNVEQKRIKPVKHFIYSLNKEPQLYYPNLNTFLKSYISHYLEPDSQKKRKLNEIIEFCREIGFCIDTESITKDLYDKCIDYLNQIGIERGKECSRSFLIFCYENNLLIFNPYEDRKSVYARCLEPDFIGYDNGIWKKYLMEYIEYLRYEKNFGDGGIDYSIRKLKILVKFFDSN